MKRLVIFTYVFALLLGLSEIGRWWGQPRFLPLAFDELVVAAAMLWAAWGAKRHGAAPLAAAWGVYCGLMLGLLVPTLDHLLGGPPKESAEFYAAVLSVMLLVGLGALVTALRLSRAASPAR